MIPIKFESPTANRSISIPLVSPSPENVVPLTAEFDAIFPEECTLLGSANYSVVGIRYFQGMAHPGECITLSREPQNPYDYNAVRVDNMHGEKVGHLKKQQAANIAPLMDNYNLGLKIEGTIPLPGDDYSLPLKLEFYRVLPHNAETSDISERSKMITLALKYAMKSDHSFKFTPGFAETDPATVNNKFLDWKVQTKELDEMFDKQAVDQLKSIPAIDMPSQFRSTVQVFDYQQAGIRWLVHQETASRAVPFFNRKFENRKWVWNCEITRCSQLQPPQSTKGSILCDEMGLGKTLQAIGLILAAPPRNYTYPKVGLSNKRETENSYKQGNYLAQSRSGGFCTLIVCPVSVMSNWQHQIETHVQEGVLRVSLYQDSYRAHILPDLKADDEPEQKKMKKETIFDINFHRVIVDEAHMIRSIKTDIFKAVMSVNTNRKLALTGTPYGNRADDIHSLLFFLGVEPLADASIFRRAITQPMEEGEVIGLSRLRTALAYVALRRSKALVNINLVEKEVKLCTVTFPEGSHKNVYDALFGTFRLAFQAVLMDGEDGESNVLNNCTSVFEMFLRIRQSCCSATLVPLKRREIALKLWSDLHERDEDKKLHHQEGLVLLNKLKGTFTQENQLPECDVCLLEMEEHDCKILRTCSHVFCDLCISRICQSYSGTCLLCRKSFEKSDMIEKRVATTAISEEKVTLSDTVFDDNFSTAPKILALLEIIKGMEPDEKGVIFSQFTSFIDLIGVALNDAGHSFVRIDGSMTETKRIESVSRFNSKYGDSPRYILCSLHAAGTGINLTRGNFAFMMDCWRMKAVENQAIDRIHRIGQDRKVTVIRFVMKNSIEERMMTLHEAKSIQAKGAMEMPQIDVKRKARLRDLKGLLLIEKD